MHVIGIDEVSRRKGQVYLTVVYDLERRVLLWVGEDRTEEAVRKFEAEELARRFAAWEQKPTELTWEILDRQIVKSKEDATLTLQPDGSVLATGKNAKFDTYTIVAPTRLR